MNKLADLKDMQFVLNDQLALENMCKLGRFKEHSKESIQMILNEAFKLASEDFAPLNAIGDKKGCIFTGGEVTVPGEFHDSFKKYCDGGWINMAESSEVGGQNVPLTVTLACNSLFFAANHSLAGYFGLTHTAAKVIELYGTPEQKRKYMMPLYSGEFAGTMCLTEPQAGSDVAAINTKAIRNPDGTFSIVGQKIFITGGNHDLTKNIINIVLARIDGDPCGTEGLSAFVVPKIRITPKGNPGEDNDVVCIGIENKMGMKGSATCTLNFGDSGQCIGELLGPERKGIVVFFHMMNEQRLLVGMQGLAQASTSYLHALSYARERRQGTADNGSSIQVPIINHPDVLRNILWMKTYTEGLRALIFFTAYCIDMSSVTTNEHEKENFSDLAAILTPVCKAYGTDGGFDVCVRSIQVFGGYGYCHDSKVEQFARDCKVMSLYEGTNGIQSNDLFKRKIRIKGNRLFRNLVFNIEKTIKAAEQIDELKVYAAEVQTHMDNLKKVTSHLLEMSSGQDAFVADSWASPYLDIVGDILLGWIFLWQATLAHKKILNNEDTEFCKAKLNTAKFYIHSLLPTVNGKIAAIFNKEMALVELKEGLITET